MATHTTGDTPTMTLRLNGVTDVPPGHVATIKTYLECRQPVRTALAQPAGVALVRLRGRDAPRYRTIFATLGERWLWWSRLLLPTEELAGLLDDAAVEAFAVTMNGKDIGLLEWDRRIPARPDLAFLGLDEAATGRGIGPWLMQCTQRRLWADAVAAITVNTCTLDSPHALEFYRRWGFVIVRQAIEVAADPRLSGHLSESAAPHVPISRPA